MNKKLQTQAASVETFGKRMSIVEAKLETFKDQSAKSYESLKDFILKTKEMLESRVDQVTQF